MTTQHELADIADVDAGTNASTPSHLRALGVLVPLAAGALAWAVSTISPLLGPLLVGLALGAAAVNIPLTSSLMSRVTSPGANRRLLRLGIVLLGLKVVAPDVVALGVTGVTVILLTVSVTFGATLLLGRALRVPRPLTLLIASGFSICGAAAIAATESTIRARAKDVALAVGLVTLFGTAMIGALPLAARLFGLNHEDAALWAGASIHEVAQVIAAASLIGGGAAALTVATTVKLGRVVLLAPLQLLIGTRVRHASVGESTGRPPVLPLFVVGFLVMVGLRSTGLLPSWSVTGAGMVTTLLLSAAMFGLGTGIRGRDLWPVPVPVLLLAAGSTIVATAVPLLLIVTVR